MHAYHVLALLSFSATALLADTLDLHHRLPLLWDQARAQLVPVWKARRVATRTRHLSLEAARWVDRQVAGRVSSLGVPALDRLVAEAAARCDGDDLAERTTSGRDGWDVVRVQMPEAEIGDFIVEVRSATAGVGSFTFKFDHMAELVGRTTVRSVPAGK